MGRSGLGCLAGLWFGRRLAPTWAFGYFNLGTAYMEEGKHREAKNAFQQAVNHEPGFAEAQHALGMAYFALGDLDHVREQASVLLHMDETLAEDLITRAGGF